MVVRTSLATRRHLQFVIDIWRHPEADLLGMPVLYLRASKPAHAQYCDGHDCACQPQKHVGKINPDSIVHSIGIIIAQTRIAVLATISALFQSSMTQSAILDFDIPGRTK